MKILRSLLVVYGICSIVAVVTGAGVCLVVKVIDAIEPTPTGVYAWP